MSAKQMAILTATVVALVVIVTLVKVGLGGRGSDDPEKKRDPAPVLMMAHLNFAHAVTQGGPVFVPGPASRLDPTKPPEEEMKQDGYRDYWFTNDNDVPVELFLMHLSCNRCLRVKVALAPEGWQAAQAVAAVGVGLPGAMGGAAQAAAQTPAPGNDVAWEMLDPEELKPGAKSFRVPPKAGGWVRLTWMDEDPDEKRLSADFRTTAPTGNAPPIRIESFISFVAPVRVLLDQKEINVGTLLNGNGPRDAVFKVLSSTRDHFTLVPEPAEVQKREHPFVTCEPPVPLTREECDDLEKKYKTPARYGYKVRVTVRERLEDGRENDLGPFRAVVLLTSDAREDALGLTVTGTVRGDVAVVSGDNVKDRVVFDAFPRSAGASKTVTIEADPSTELVIDRKPAFLEAELKADEQTPASRRKTWSLTVTIPPNAVSGKFPNPEDPGLSDTAVYLKVTKPGRRVRIPVGGTAIQR